MLTVVKTLKERLRWALANAQPEPLKQADLARGIGLSRSAVSDWLSGATQTLEGSNLTKAAALLGVNSHWLATGEGQPKRKESKSNTLTPIRTWEHEDDLPPGEYAFIPRLDVHLSAGNGHEQIELDFVKEKPQAFRVDWIRKKNLRPAKLAVMTVSGDSMEPRLYDEDAVVVDTSQTEVIDGKIYALWYDGGERVKRLYRRPGGGLVIHSDNADSYPPMTLSADETEHIRIIGRVVHIDSDGGL